MWQGAWTAVPVTEATMTTEEQLLDTLNRGSVDEALGSARQFIAMYPGEQVQ